MRTPMVLALAALASMPMPAQSDVLAAGPSRRDLRRADRVNYWIANGQAHPLELHKLARKNARRRKRR
jgi:hypothetical protein